MNKITKIYITGDTQRSTTNQLGNITRLYFQLKAQLENVFKVFGASVELKVTENRLPDNKWAMLYSEEAVNKKSWIEENADLNESTLVICWETPYSWIKRFKKLGIPYISVITHHTRVNEAPIDGIPLRNPIYSLSINTPWSINNDYYFKKLANFHRAQYARKDRIPFIPDTAVIMGQTMIDRSLLNNGKMLKIDMFEDKIKEVVSKHALPVFKPHPHNNNEEMIKYMQGLGCHPWYVYQNPTFNYNGYDVLSDPFVSHIYSISSSTITEAEWFEKPSTRWDMTYKKHLDEHTPILFNDFISDKFWNWFVYSYLFTKGSQNEI